MGDPTLLNWLDYIVGVAILIATIVILGLQLTKQSKVSSANLILKLLEPWREDKFQKLLREITNPNVKEYDELEIEKFLNQLEDIATFWKDGTLHEIHVKEFFGANLKAVRDDEFIQNYLKWWRNKNPDYYFTNLTELMKKVNKWKI